jgi:hypothetical protein
MLRLAFLGIGILVCTAVIATGDAADFAGSSGNVPTKSTPHKLQEAWLHFHETDLCQEVDAIFVFNGSGMEVWCRIESDKNLQRFSELFGSLKRSFPVELYLTRAEADKKKADEEDPPPSFWQNLELRANLGEHIALIAGQAFEEPFEPKPTPRPDSFNTLLKQRLRLYAEQTLNLNRRVARYAVDLEALTRVAYDPDQSHDIQSKAIAVCAKHAQGLEKQIAKLTASLELAFPSSERKRRTAIRDAPAISEIRGPAEEVSHISISVQSVGRRVHQFIYPEEYTVELEDLRHPSLLQSLDSLRELVSDFEKSLGKPGRKQN